MVKNEKITVYTIQEYVDKYHEGSQSKLADYLGLDRQEVNRWKMRGDLVDENHDSYSKRRNLRKKNQ